MGDPIAHLGYFLDLRRRFDEAERLRDVSPISPRHFGFAFFDCHDEANYLIVDDPCKVREIQR